MCKRVFFAVLIAAAVLGVAQPATAQSTAGAIAAERAAMERARIDSLLPLLQQARAAVQQRREQEQRAELIAAGKLDTVRVGPLRVVGRGRSLEHAASLVRDVWQEHASVVGTAAARLDGVTFLVQHEGRSPLLSELAERPRHYQIRLPSGPRAGTYGGRQLRGAFYAALAPLLPPAVQQWVGDGDFTDPAAFSTAYRELILGDARGASRCLRGAADTCALLLGFADPGADYSGWYTRAQLRELAHQNHAGLDGLDFHRCVLRNDLDACVAAFARAGGPPPPLSGGARASLLYYTLRAGGNGAFERLVADSAADVVSALTRAGGQSVDAAVVGWQQAIVRAQPNSYADVGRSLLVTVLWCGLLLTLALRSTRWRIG